MSLRHVLLIAVAVIASMPSVLLARDYELRPQAVADGIWVIEGHREHFSRSNGGNIVNTGIIATDAGAVVIDTGPSKLYAEQLLAQARQFAGGRVDRAYVTHAHPDHFLGNHVFIAASIPVHALAQTRAQIQRDGASLIDTLSRLIGDALSGTVSAAPDVSVEAGAVTVGGRLLRLIAGRGHTSADLAVYDEQTRTLFAGDLVFHQRTPTTPHADLAQWLEQLDVLAALDYRVLVPGHGPVVRGPEAIAQTRAYLLWLRGTLKTAAESGRDMAELMRLPPPAELGELAVFRDEFSRSVEHLFPAEEDRVLPIVKKP